MINEIPERYKGLIHSVHYYGSGVSTVESKRLIQAALKNVLPLYNILISEMIYWLACRACSDGEASYVVILGTGTNACYFDGEKVIDKVPSLGYLFDDYGLDIILVGRSLKNISTK